MEDAWRQNLRKMIERRGITMHALSLKINKNKHYITQLLNKDRSPSVKTLRPIADALDVTVEEILSGAAPSTEEQQIAKDFANLTAQQKQAVRIIISTLREANLKNGAAE